MNGAKWYEIVRNSTKRYKMLGNDTNCAMWYECFENLRNGPDGAKWCEMLRKCTK